MKITLATHEAAALAAESLNRNIPSVMSLTAEDITISVPSPAINPSSSVFTFTEPISEENKVYIRDIVNTVSDYHLNAVVERVIFIKAIRALTKCNLKSAVDFSNQVLPTKD